MKSKARAEVVIKAYGGLDEVPIGSGQEQRWQRTWKAEMTEGCVDEVLAG